MYFVSFYNERMNQEYKNYFAEYSALTEEIDAVSLKLEKQHARHLSCKSGCDLCCMDYSIFPVEFFAILNDLKSAGFVKSNIYAEQDPECVSCVFLKNHRCTIYTSRPVICRTHGLPLLYANDDGEWELSACELNFKHFDFDEFSTKNTFAQDKFNSKLFLLNKKFIADFKEKKFAEFDLIPLKKLLEYL